MPRQTYESRSGRQGERNDRVYLPSISQLDLRPIDHQDWTVTHPPDNRPSTYSHYQYNNHASSFVHNHNQIQGYPSMSIHDIDYAPPNQQDGAFRSRSSSAKNGKKRPRPSADDEKRNGHKQKEKIRRGFENEEFKDLEGSVVMMGMPMAEEERQGQHNSSKGHSKATMNKEAKQRKWNAGKNDCALEYTKLEILSKSNIATSCFTYLVQVMPDVLNIIPDEIKNPKGKGLTIRDVPTPVVDRTDQSRMQYVTLPIYQIEEPWVPRHSRTYKEPSATPSFPSYQTLSLPDAAPSDRKFSVSSSGGESSVTTSSEDVMCRYKL